MPAGAGLDRLPALVTQARLEARDGALLLGLQGLAGDTLEPQQATAESLGAFVLDREHAHQMLRMLRDQAEQAGWNMAQPAAWMAPLTHGDKHTAWA